MKIAFSASVCPTWDLETLLSRVAGMDFSGIELAHLDGQAHLPSCPALTGDPPAVAERFHQAGVELVCLGTALSFEVDDSRTRRDHQQRLRETLKLAHDLRCPYVRVSSGRLPARASKPRLLMNAAKALREMAPVATELERVILLENDGDFAASRDTWFILDAVNHPAVQCCWNPLNARLAGEAASLSVPRLHRRIAMTHLADAAFDSATGRLRNDAPLGEGQLDLERYLVLLSGVACEPWLVVDRLPGQDAADFDPTEALTAAAVWIRAALKKIAEAGDLSAYKGDKNAPKYPVRQPAAGAAG